MSLKEYEKLELEKEISSENLQKIAIFGLANAGKTSIVKTVLYQFEALIGLTPTKNVERTNLEFLGRELLIWDFGGQERYRHNYLAKPEKYFEGIKYVYYVVDAQDAEVIRESMAYFLRIFANTMKFSPDAKIYIFFHKIDPEYEGPTNFYEIENTFIMGVLEKVQEMARENPTIFHTSIKDPMSIVSAFSQPLLSNENIYDTLCESIKMFCIENQLNFGILFTTNFFEIGHYSDPAQLKRNIGSISTFMKGFDFEGFSGRFPEMTIGFNRIHTEKFFIEVGNKFPFYFSVGINTIAPSTDFSRILEHIKEFCGNLETILRNSEIIRIGVLRTEAIIRSYYFDDF